MRNANGEDTTPEVAGDRAERSVVTIILTEQQVELLDRVRNELHPDQSLEDVVLLLVSRFLNSQGEVN